MDLTTNFSLEAMTRTETGLPNEANTSVIANLTALCKNVLEPLRERVGAPIFVTSGYRSQAVNKAVGGVGNSQHLLGEAADTHVNTMSVEDWYQFVKRAGVPFDQCIQEFNDWVHVSYNANGKQRGECWRYVKGQNPVLDEVINFNSVA